MAVTSEIETDYLTVTHGVGLLDRSERGKLALTGSDARDFLHGQVTQDIKGVPVGSGCYAAFLNNKGKMLGDLRMLNTGGELLLDTERVALQALFNMIRHYSLGYELELHKRTLETGLLSMLGPLSSELLTAVTEVVPGPTEHEHVVCAVDGVLVRAVRTDLGVDLLLARDQLEKVRARLRAAGAVNVSEAAAECVRIESGRPRYGMDMDDTVIPQEARLNARAVSFTKGCYVGQETVARLFYRGKPNRELAGIRSSAPIRVGARLTYKDRLVGTVTSSAVSPRFGCVGLTLLRKEASVGSSLRIDGEQDALVTALPFG